MGTCFSCSLCWEDTVMIEETHNNRTMTEKSDRVDDIHNESPVKVGDRKIRKDTDKKEIPNISKYGSVDVKTGSENKTNDEQMDILINKLSIEYSSDIMNNLLIKLETTELSIEQATKLWEMCGDKLISKIKKQPELCIKFKLHEMNNEICSNYIKKMGIVLYERNQQEATALLVNNLECLATLLRKTNRRGADLLLDNNINKGMLLENADACKNHHKWGIAFVLYKKGGDDDSAVAIIQKYAPNYVKKLLHY